MACLADLWPFCCKSLSSPLAVGEQVCLATNDRKRSAFTTLVIAMSLLMGWQSTGQCQWKPTVEVTQPEQTQSGIANSELSSTESASSTDRDTTPICRTLQELIQWQTEGHGSDVEFDLTAFLVYTGENWDRIFVEHRRQAVEMIADVALTKKLFQFEAGTPLNVRGRGYFQKNGVAILEAKEADASTTSGSGIVTPGRQGPNMIDSPKFRFMFIDGEIQEVIKLEDRTLVLARDKIADFEIIQMGKNKKLRPSNTGGRWRFYGGIAPSPVENPRQVLFQYHLMHERQMNRSRDPEIRAAHRRQSRKSSAIDIDSTDGGSPTNSLSGSSVPFDGLVAFSDGRRNVGIVNGHQRFRIKTFYADKVAVGAKVSGVGVPSRLRQSGNGCIRLDALITEVDRAAAQSLPVPTRIICLGELEKMPQLPPMIKLEATVEYCVVDKKTVTLFLQAKGGKLVARVALGEGASRKSLEFLNSGTQVECFGMPVNHTFDETEENASDASHLSMFIGSIDDIKVLDRPVTLSKSRLLTSGVVVFASLLLGGFWIIRLRRRVKAGDRSLTEIDHHLQTAFGAMQCGVLIVDDQSRILRSNHRLGLFFGVEPAVDSCLNQCVSEIEDSLTSSRSMSNVGR